MGYQHRLWTSVCGDCKRKSLWSFDEPKIPAKQWTCNCGAVNRTAPLNPWPEVPRVLHLGRDKTNLLKMYPVPPEQQDREWAQPFSVRSFIYQASRALRGCYYTCDRRAQMFDETIFTDACAEDAHDDERHDCAILAGWSAGRNTCPLWEAIAAMCDTDPERRFLWTYLRYVKDRQFPMILPQTRVGITERRRADFVAFVPIQYWRYQWIAIELDAAHPDDKRDDDKVRDRYYSEHSYEVISLRPKDRGYFDEVRLLVERFDVLINMAKSDPWEVAVDRRVTSFDPSTEVPF